MKTKALVLDVICIVVVLLSIVGHSNWLLVAAIAVMILRSVLVYRAKKQNSDETK